MAIYSMHLNGPKEAQKGSISRTQADSLEEATRFFAERKNLPLSEFKKIFIVIEVKK